jgi:hypothetical protein
MGSIDRWETASDAATFIKKIKTRVPNFLTLIHEYSKVLCSNISLQAAYNYTSLPQPLHTDRVTRYLAMNPYIPIYRPISPWALQADQQTAYSAHLHIAAAVRSLALPCDRRRGQHVHWESHGTRCRVGCLRVPNLCGRMRRHQQTEATSLPGAARSVSVSASRDRLRTEI